MQKRKQTLINAGRPYNLTWSSHRDESNSNISGRERENRKSVTKAMQ